jgi:uncharacterized Ntn-hydrolase superfamily protein
VGAVATQAITELAHGPRVIGLLERGLDAEQALAESLAADAGAAGRQVGVVDRRGRARAHTGSNCIPFAGQAVGDGVACQANMMVSAEVWPAMLDAYQASEGPLASRLLTALDAADAAGGDIRGRQSAAMLVVPPAGEPWRTSVSLRVDDHPEPLVELRRLLHLHEAYAVAARADSLVGEGRHGEASVLYRRAAELAPESDELRFWAGLGVAQAGELDAGTELVRAVTEAKPVWRELLERLEPEIAPAAAAVRARLKS